MLLFETIFTISTIAFLALTCFPGKHSILFRVVCYLSIGSLFLHGIFEIIRWQMIPTYLTFLILTFLLLKKSTSYLVFRILGLILGFTLMVTSAFFAWGMPIINLPDPDGPLAIGYNSFSITDHGREELFTSDPLDHRELFAEIWYPAIIDNGKNSQNPITMWQELYSGSFDGISFFMGYLKGIKTHAYRDASPDLENGPYPVIFFNHGLQMFSAQNTLLMEHLASHGYVLISIAHPFESIKVNLKSQGTVIPEFITSTEKFNEAMRWIQDSSQPILKARDSIANLSDRSKRADIMRHAIENSPVNQVVENWKNDNLFMLDIFTADRHNDFIFSKIMDTSRIGVMGMSVGGATATELCKLEPRYKAGINVDGLQYGNLNDVGLSVPFMMLYSDEGVGNNDFLYLTSLHDYHEIHFNGAKHADFTDFPMMWPVMRLYGQLGSIPACRMTMLHHHVVLNFWNHYLKGRSYVSFEPEQYPELIFHVKNKNNADKDD